MTQDAAVRELYWQLTQGFTSVPGLHIQWTPGSTVSGSVTWGGGPPAQVRIMAGTEAGIIRILVGIIHELAHWHGQQPGHGAIWRMYYVRLLTDLAGVDLRDAQRVPHPYDLDLLAEWRILQHWRRVGIPPYLERLVAALGHPPIPRPIYQFEQLTWSETRALRIPVWAVRWLQWGLEPYRGYVSWAADFAEDLATIPEDDPHG